MIKAKGGKATIKGRAGNVIIETAALIEAVREVFARTEDAEPLCEYYCKVIRGELQGKESAVELAKIVCSPKGVEELLHEIERRENEE